MKYSQGPVRKGHFTIMFNMVNANQLTQKDQLR
jgi:hypothetical protein